MTSIGDISFDKLVLAQGATTNFFGNKQLSELAFPMKTIGEALEIRNHLLMSFENAVNCEDKVEQLAHLNVVVIGGECNWCRNGWFYC